MLCMDRKEGEWIQIGADIRVCVTKARGGKVRLGIEAPPDVRILRNELLSDEEAIRDGREGEGEERDRAA